MSYKWIYSIWILVYFIMKMFYLYLFYEELGIFYIFKIFGFIILELVNIYLMIDWIFKFFCEEKEIC